MRAMANPFVHVELNTTDVSRAKAFYGKLFDWKLEDVSNTKWATRSLMANSASAKMLRKRIANRPLKQRNLKKI